MTSVAVLALAAVDDRTEAVAGSTWLLAQEGRRPSLRERLGWWLTRTRQTTDNDIQLVGWPWYQETAAWVEPTSWALLALKHMRPHLSGPGIRRRIAEAERLLADRMCHGGGWNYGSRAILGEAVPPFPDTTAIALIALQGSRLPGVIEPSLDRLDEMLTQGPSSLSLALGALSFRLHGRDPRPLRERLRSRLERTIASGDVRTLALALMSLDEGPSPLELGHA